MDKHVVPPRAVGGAARLLSSQISVNRPESYLLPMLDFACQPPLDSASQRRSGSFYSSILARRMLRRLPLHPVAG